MEPHKNSPSQFHILHKFSIHHKSNWFLSLRLFPVVLNNNMYMWSMKIKMSVLSAWESFQWLSEWWNLTIDSIQFMNRNLSELVPQEVKLEFELVW